MGLFSFLFGLCEEPVMEPNEFDRDLEQEKSEFHGDNYYEYYDQLHDDAICGDIDAQMEMREEFGDDWEGEF